jgi:phosphate transport system substrate-binding protein
MTHALRRFAAIASALSAAALGLAACGGSTASNSGTGAAEAAIIRSDGSSTVYPITEAVAEEYQKASGARVTVAISGTGGGFQKFCRGETDISNASRPISAAEIEACKATGVDYMELPIAYDGLAIVVNPKNTWATSITVDELRKLWAPEAQGKIMRWNQVRASWPDRQIHLFGAGVDSGTFDYFTEAIVGKAKSSRGDFTSSEDDNVLVQGIIGDELALGFLPLAYVEQNKGAVKLVPLDDAKKENGEGPITPAAETVRNGTYQPLSRPLFIYVARKSADRPEVAAFVDAFFTAGPLLREVGYVELTPALYDVAKRHFTERRLGSAFADGVSTVGVTLEDLLAREK